MTAVADVDTEKAAEFGLNWEDEPTCQKTTNLGLHRVDEPPAPCCRRPATWVSRTACGVSLLSCEAHYARYLSHDWEAGVVCRNCRQGVGPEHWTWVSL